MRQKELSTLRQIITLLRKINIHPAYFLIPIVLSIIAAAFEGIGMGLLIPMLNGFLSQDFSFIKEIPGLSYVLSYLPQNVLDRDRSLFVVLIGIFVSIILLKNICRYAASVSMAYLGTRTVHHLRKQVFNAYLSFGKLYFDRTNVGRHSIVLSQFTSEALQPLLNIDRFFHAAFSVTAYIIVMCVISWKLTLVCMPLFIILHFGVQRLIVVIRKMSRLSVERASDSGKQVIEILSTISLVKAFNTEDKERLRYTEISDDRARLDYRTSVLKHLIGPIQETITLIAALLLLSGMLYLLVKEGHTSAPSFLVYFYLVLNIANKFGVFSGFQSNLAHASSQVQEVLSVFNPDGKFIIPGGPKIFPGLQHSIEFRNLDFFYSADRNILNGLTFIIKKNAVTALVGPTGVGKTTIINLLLRFYDCPSNSIFLDGTDIRSFSSSSLRAHMAVVSQDTLLFHDTLRSNIVYGQKLVTEKELNDVVRRSRLEDYVHSLPQGLDTLIGDRGVKLSGGEKQRVSIARALLKKADILILDEATSSLDSETEKLVQEAIDEVIHGKTAIVIAHRLATIKNAEKIVVIDRGKCIEEGTHEELLKKEGLFYRLWQEQMFT